MRRKKKVVRKISLATADRILADLPSMSLERAGGRYGIMNHQTIPRLIQRAYERAGRRPPPAIRSLLRGSGPKAAVAVNRKGTIVIPKELIIDSFGFRRGRKFTARAHGRKIILTAAAGPGRKAGDRRRP